VKDILGGQVDFSVSSPFGVIGQINAGAMKMLAVARPDRMVQLPDVPTFAELGHPDLTASFWTAIFAPAAMDDALVAEINAGISEVLNDPETDAMLDKIGQFKVGGTPDVLAAQLEDDKAKWGGVIKARNLVLE
jgi:tripartite-type tricarboxylate transporter receptor subunit TctC